MTVERTRWSDDRLDDLASLVHANDTRIDRLNTLIEAHDRDISTIARTGDRRSDRGFQIWMAVILIVGTGVANIITTIATAH